MERQFVKVYSEGLDRLQVLFRDATPSAAAVWVYLAKRMLAGEQAVVVSRDTLALELGLSVRSVSSATVELQRSGAISVHKIGNANCYSINSDELWKGAEVRKHSASIRAVAVVGFRENPDLAERLSDRIAQPELHGVVSAPAFPGVKVDA